MAVLTPIPTSVIWKPYPSHLHQQLSSQACLITTIPTCMRWKLTPGLTFNFLMIMDVKHLYVFFWKLLTRSLVHFFNFLFVVAVEFFSCFGYQSLMRHMVCKHSLLACRLSFHTVPLQMLLCLMWSYSCFCFVACAWGDQIFKKIITHTNAMQYFSNF